MNRGVWHHCKVPLTERRETTESVLMCFPLLDLVHMTPHFEALTGLAGSTSPLRHTVCLREARKGVGDNRAGTCPGGAHWQSTMPLCLQLSPGPPNTKLQRKMLWRAEPVCMIRNLSTGSGQPLSLPLLSFSLYSTTQWGAFILRCCCVLVCLGPSSFIPGSLASLFPLLFFLDTGHMIGSTVPTPQPHLWMVHGRAWQTYWSLTASSMDLGRTTL